MPRRPMPPAAAKRSAPFASACAAPAAPDSSPSPPWRSTAPAHPPCDTPPAGPGKHNSEPHSAPSGLCPDPPADPNRPELTPARRGPTGWSTEPNRTGSGSGTSPASGGPGAARHRARTHPDRLQRSPAPRSARLRHPRRRTPPTTRTDPRGPPARPPTSPHTTPRPQPPDHRQQPREHPMTWFITQPISAEDSDTPQSAKSR